MSREGRTAPGSTAPDVHRRAPHIWRRWLVLFAARYGPDGRAGVDGALVSRERAGRLPGLLPLLMAWPLTKFLRTGFLNSASHRQVRSRHFVKNGVNSWLGCIARYTL
jgi:hypothetical protein